MVLARVEVWRVLVCVPATRGHDVCILGMSGAVEDVAVRGATALLRRAVQACLRDGNRAAAPEVSGLTMLVSVRGV
jgi:hypothetical protein